MRSRVRDRQKVWWVSIEEVHNGIDTYTKYNKPIMKKQTVSATAGSSAEISAGLVPEYDREVVSYDRNFKPVEGTLLFVDVVPKLDEEGNLIMGDDGVTPVTVPDYRLVKIFDTQRGNVAVYGIERIGGSDS